MTRYDRIEAQRMDREDRERFSVVEVQWWVALMLQEEHQRREREEVDRACPF